MAVTAEPSTAPHPFEVARAAGREPFRVRDLSQADFGRREIRLAEQEMPGLMALRTQYAGQRLGLAELPADRHQAGHLVLGQHHLLAPERGE